MGKQSNSIHYRFAANVGVDYESTQQAPYGGVHADIPVSVASGLSSAEDQVDGKLALDDVDYAHLRMFALGAYQPLPGYMNTSEIQSVISIGCLTDFLPWEVPIFLGTDEAFEVGNHINLIYQGYSIGRLHVSECAPLPEVLNTEYGCGSKYILAGELALIMYPEEELTDALVDWNELVARENPHKIGMCRTAMVGVELWRTSDEYLMRSTLELSDQILIHPVGERDGTENCQLPQEAVDAANQFVQSEHYADKNIAFSAVPSQLAQKNPSIIHLCIVYQNLGCQRLILVSDSHQDVSKELAAFDIECILLQPAFYCGECAGHATEKICNHSERSRSSLDEKEIVNHLLVGQQLPVAIVRPEVARILSKKLSSEKSLASKATNKRHIFPHASEISTGIRQQINGHRSAVLWMTGLSGSGKSTLTTGLEKELVLSGHQICVLDGDTLRNGLCGDLGFSVEARKENLRRAAETAKLLMDNGMLVLASFISPFTQERNLLREIIGKDFYEVYVEASLEDCERRDPKGLYQRARSGLIPEFTGVSSPYEVPVNPEFRVNTSMLSVKESIRYLLTELQSTGLLKHSPESDPIRESSKRSSLQFLHSGRSN